MSKHYKNPYAMAHHVDFKQMPKHPKRKVALGLSLGLLAPVLVSLVFYRRHR